MSSVRERPPPSRSSSSCRSWRLPCEKPETADRPVSSWTPRELADEAVKRGIVTSISPRTVERFLKGERFTAPSATVLAHSTPPRPTRTEADFAAHITQTIQTAPHAGWIFVTDQLNTHQSEALVRLVAAQCGIQEELGLKGKSGHQALMSTRAAFLSDKSHRIRFVYTPRHSRLSQPD